jgi:plasmid stability protein
MPTLTIRNLPEQVHRALRLRAAENARSVEAEVRALLASAVAARAPVGVAEERQPFRDEVSLPSAIGAWGKSPPGRSEVDRLIAQRRVEAAFEGEEITAREYADLNARIDAWTMNTADVEQWLARRRGEV